MGANVELIITFQTVFKKIFCVDSQANKCRYYILKRIA